MGKGSHHLRSSNPLHESGQTAFLCSSTTLATQDMYIVASCVLLHSTPLTVPEPSARHHLGLYFLETRANACIKHLYSSSIRVCMPTQDEARTVVQTVYMLSIEPSSVRPTFREAVALHLSSTSTLGKRSEKRAAVRPSSHLHHTDLRAIRDARP